MFTGIVEAIGEVLATRRREEGMALTLSSGGLDLSALRLGDSVAVMGVCLTVVGREADRFTADVAYESLARSTLGGLRPGARVHLERALPAHGRFDGHIVQGHVDAVGAIRQVARRGRAWQMEVAVPAELAPTIVEKGSVAIDGTSLTVNKCGAGWLSVAIVPHTGAHTLLIERSVGDPVNIETDVLGKYVVHALRLGVTPGGGGGLKGALERNGYL